MNSKNETTKVVFLTDKELREVIDFIEVEFYETIRRDTDIDVIDYAMNLMSALKKFREARNEEDSDLPL